MTPSPTWKACGALATADVLTGGNAANGTVATDPAMKLLEFFVGGGGNDTIDGGQGYDLVSYQTSTVGVSVTLNDTLDGVGTDGFGGTDVLRNIEGVRGSAHNDVLTGSNTAAFESFEGREGNDTIDGWGAPTVQTMSAPRRVWWSTWPQAPPATAMAARTH
jgi:Ca2+-binding RTX toxin-like protein